MRTSNLRKQKVIGLLTLNKGLVPQKKEQEGDVRIHPGFVPSLGRVVACFVLRGAFVFSASRVTVAAAADAAAPPHIFVSSQVESISSVWQC